MVNLSTTLILVTDRRSKAGDRASCLQHQKLLWWTSFSDTYQTLPEWVNQVMPSTECDEPIEFDLSAITPGTIRKVAPLTPLQGKTRLLTTTWRSYPPPTTSLRPCFQRSYWKIMLLQNLGARPRLSSGQDYPHPKKIKICPTLRAFVL